MTDGRKVRISLTGGDYGARIDTVNGATLTERATGAFDGTMSIRMTPQTGTTGNPDNTYVGICNGLDLWNNAAKNVAQANVGFCMYWGSRYIDLAGQAKIGGFLGANALNPSNVNGSEARTGFFEALHNSVRKPSITVTTFASYTQPNAGYFPEDGTDAAHLMFIGTTSNTSNDPPLVGQEWIYFEHESDYRQNRGNANGRTRLDAWSRNGYLGYLELPLTYKADYDFAYQYIAYYEYIGGLFNDPSTANANNFFEVSHPIAAVNRAVNDRIGPPPGFLL